MGLLKTLLFGVILALCAQHIFHLVKFMGYHKTVYNHAPGKCTSIPDVEHGSEDIQLATDGIALITGGTRFGADTSSLWWTKVKGYVKMFDFNHPEKGARDVRIEGPVDMETFNPHGISIITDQGTTIVFMINHTPDRDLVEKFEWDKEKYVLRHLESIHVCEYPVNDLVAISKDSFYITQYFHNTELTYAQFEAYLRLRWGSIYYYDGTTKSSKTVASKLLMPNGINLSPDKKFVYVSLFGDETIEVFKRSQDNSLEHIQSFDLYSSPDNLDVSSDGYLWSGNHPVLHKALEYFPEPHKLSPSQILRMKINPDGTLSDLIEVYANDGSEISGTSVGVYYKKKMLIGSVASTLLYCDVKTL